MGAFVRTELLLIYALINNFTLYTYTLRYINLSPVDALSVDEHSGGGDGGPPGQPFEERRHHLGDRSQAEAASPTSTNDKGKPSSQPQRQPAESKKKDQDHGPDEYHHLLPKGPTSSHQPPPEHGSRSVGLTEAELSGHPPTVFRLNPAAAEFKPAGLRRNDPPIPHQPQTTDAVGISFTRPPPLSAASLSLHHQRHPFGPPPMPPIPQTFGSPSPPPPLPFHASLLEQPYL